MAKKTVTNLPGVYASGVKAGIKPGRRDLSFLFVPDAFSSAAVFTQNRFVAPPLVWTREAQKKNTLRAVVVNAGCANAATGRIGYQNAKRTAELAASYLGIKPNEVGVASTGIIGVQLPMDKITSGLKALLKNPRARQGHLASQAILTTDLCKKETYCSERVGTHRYTVAGYAKGSGMIAPNMATMLGFLVTDVRVPRALLQKLFREAVDRSFNMTSVDTDTSTNDMVMIFSTGRQEFDPKNKRQRAVFEKVLTDACVELAKKIARDGEGATKLIEVSVQGARSEVQARAIAKSIVDSPLVKTAIHGSDPNWGRVAAAAGKTPKVALDPEKIDISFGGAPVMRRGRILPFERDKVRKLLTGKEVKVEVDLHLGKGAARAWGCDLTKGYIDINTAYS